MKNLLAVRIQVVFGLHDREKPVYCPNPCRIRTLRPRKTCLLSDSMPYSDSTTAKNLFAVRILAVFGLPDSQKPFIVRINPVFGLHDRKYPVHCPKSHSQFCKKNKNPALGRV
ncbi:hypothetical protein [Neobacillus notoginsengisoli]|uniref:hypothetical protein n=1 Tax=Neobacillus notoginsengisoli TaxID=1578198 RepID=UPI00115CB320|nr:hypothetical protein [Neobacillus notoginsengisoli]